MIEVGHRANARLLGVVTGALLLSGVAVAASVDAPHAAPGGVTGVPADVVHATTEIVHATDSARRAAGCPPLRVDERLTAAAAAHASDMARNGYFSHTDENGTTAAQRIAASGYPGAFGENIAAGLATAGEVMHYWMGTAGYRRNIEDCRFTAVGVGYDPDGHHWVQDFGG